MRREPSSSETTSLLSDIDALKPSLSIKALLIGSGIGMLLWTGIICMILALT